MPETHPHILTPGYEPAQPFLVSLFFNARPRGSTDYRPDIRLADPAHSGQWSFERDAHGFIIFAIRSLRPLLAGSLVCVCILAALWTLYFTGVINDLFTVIFPSVFLVPVALLYPIMGPKLRKAMGITPIMQFDTLERTVTLHGITMPAADIEAVEHVGLASGTVVPTKKAARKIGQTRPGGSYTTHVHLVLRTKRHPHTPPDKRSTEPDARYHIIAIAHVGLTKLGSDIARALDVPYNKANLGVFVHYPAADETS